MIESSPRLPPDAAATLSPADAAAVDALLEQRRSPAVKLNGADGADPAGPQIDPARRARLQDWFNLLGSAPVPAPSSDLLARTLAAVKADRMILPRPEAQGATGRVPAAPERAPRPRRSYLAEVGAMLVAAGILVAVLIPAVGEIRQAYRRTLCATNLASAGTGFGSYAAANNRQLPCLPASPDGNWLHPGPGGHTNTANLLPLINAGYIQPAQLICAGRGLPDNAAADPTLADIHNCSYSYINMFGAKHPGWDSRHATIILADANPLFSAPAAASPDANSFNHAGKGTYILRGDASVTWETSPNIGPANDNIWTISNGSQRVTIYTGTETAASLSDVFLSP